MLPLGMGMKKMATNTGTSRKCFQTCQVRFPHKFTETNALKRYFLHSTIPQIHLEWWPLRFSLPKGNASTAQQPDLPCRYEADVLGWAPSKDHCCLPCTLPKLILETSASTYSHLQRDTFVPLLLAFWSPNTWISSVLIVLGWGQQGSSAVTTAHALSTQEALSESGFTPDIGFSVWTIYSAELAFMHPPPFTIWNPRQI